MIYSIFLALKRVVRIIIYGWYQIYARESVI